MYREYHNPESLDEDGFVFLNGNGRPLWCRLWEGEPWLFRWHVDNHWVSWCKIEQDEIESFPRNLSQLQQGLYHQQHKKWEEGN